MAVKEDKNRANILVYTTLLAVGQACDRFVPGMNEEEYLRMVELTLRRAHEFAGQSLATLEVENMKKLKGAN